MRIVILISLILAISFAKAENTAFSSLQIADSLKQNANVVIRYDSISYHLINPGKAEMRRHKVITILNRYGEKHAEVLVFYDRNSKVNSFSGEILDEKGNRIRKIKKDEITDNSLVASYTLFQDDRYISFNALNTSYPYTIVADYTVTFNGIVSIERWLPIPDYKVSVEKSVFTLIADNNQIVNFKHVNLPENIEKETIDNRTIYHWKISNHKALESEPFSPSYLNIAPVLWSTPEKFQYEGTMGEYKSWKSFGDWEWKLVDGKQDISETTKNEIIELTKNASEDKEKASLIYKYFQNKTRYVSIQLGIGGWEPFPASVVDKVGYGDCKALSNYMVSLLKVAGINSFYAIIGNGNAMIKFPDFPSMGQANHAIVCVPFSNDTTWLECTSQEYPFGYIGLGNDDRYALLITENGGKLVKTPSLKKEKNIQTRKATVLIDDQGNANAIVSTEYSGLQFGNRNFLLTESKEDQKKWYLKNLDVNTPVLNSFKIQQPEQSLPEISEELQMLLPKYSTITGNRMFLKPNLLNSFSRPPTKTKKREFEIERKFAYTDVDSVIFQIPDGFIVESAMEDVSIENEFGKYTSSIQFNGNELIYIRNIEMNKGIWPAEMYDEFHSFYTKIWKSDQGKVVFVKN